MDDDQFNITATDLFVNKQKSDKKRICVFCVVLNISVNDLKF